MRLSLELYCVIVIKHVTFFTICAKLLVTAAFTFTFRFEQKYWRIDGFGEKKARIGGFAYPYSPPSLRFLVEIIRIILNYDAFEYHSIVYKYGTLVRGHHGALTGSSDSV